MASPVEQKANELEARAAAWVRERRLAGLAAGVVHAGELVWSKGLGFADVGARRAADARTLYRIASITKTFTGTAIMRLRDEGRLQLDDPLVAHVPELRAARSPFGPIETVTIRRMLSHESGLLTDPPGTDWSAAAYQSDSAKTLADAAEITTAVPPNTQQKYSNLAYQLLGEVVSRLAGVPYAEYVRCAILEPLGMRSTAFDPPPEELRARCAVGYAARSFSDALDVAPHDPPATAEGGLWSSVEDLARWVAFQLGHGPLAAGGQLLDRATVREMQRPRYLGDEAWTEAWGISWYAKRLDDVIWVQHAGGLHGFTSLVCFDPKSDVGAIVLVNGIRAGDLAMELGAIARAAVRAAPAKIDPPAPMPPEWRPLLGLYADPQYDVLLRLEWRDGRLRFVETGEDDWAPTLTPAGEPDVFTVDPGVRESGEPCTFRRRADGRVVSVMLGPSTFRRIDAVEDA